MKNILYITYDSLDDSISQSQINPLLKDLSKKNNVFLISFEKIINQKKITYVKLWKKFEFKNSKFQKFKQLIKCYFFIVSLIKSNKIDIIHCRSYLPGLIAFYVKKFYKIKYIFDIRGFWFDEKKDAKLINGIIYKFAKLFEKKLYNNADFIITLSKKSIYYIVKNLKVKRSKIQNVSCFTDTKKFEFYLKNLEKKITFGYIGNVGLSYNFDMVLNFLSIYNKFNKNWQLFFVNNYLNKNERQILFQKFKYKKKIKFYNTKFKYINNLYKKINYGIYFLKNDFSKIASCPTKLGELLSSGIPVITNGQIGDIEFYLNNKKKSGFIINKLSINKINNLNKLLTNKKKYSQMQKNALQIAKKYFDEKKNLLIYKKVYKSLI